MHNFVQNIENTAVYLSGEGWRLPYTLAEVKEEIEASKKSKIVLNRFREKQKPKLQEIAEGFCHFSSLVQDSAIFGTLLEDSQEARKKYKEIIFFYQSSQHLEKLKKNMKEGETIEFYPLGDICQGGYNISFERKTQQIHNSSGSFLIPLPIVNNKVYVSVILLKEKESLNYKLLNEQLEVNNPFVNTDSKYQKIRFFFLLFSGSSTEGQKQSIVTFEGYLFSTSSSQDLPSEAVFSFNCRVSLESEIQILDHDYYANQILK